VGRLVRRSTVVTLRRWAAAAAAAALASVNCDKARATRKRRSMAVLFRCWAVAVRAALAARLALVQTMSSAAAARVLARDSPRRLKQSFAHLAAHAKVMAAGRRVLVLGLQRVARGWVAVATRSALCAWHMAASDEIGTRRATEGNARRHARGVRLAVERASGRTARAAAGAIRVWRTNAGRAIASHQSSQLVVLGANVAELTALMERAATNLGAKEQELLGVLRDGEAERERLIVKADSEAFRIQAESAGIRDSLHADVAAANTVISELAGKLAAVRESGRVEVAEREVTLAAAAATLATLERQATDMSRQLIIAETEAATAAAVAKEVAEGDLVALRSEHVKTIESSKDIDERMKEALTAMAIGDGEIARLTSEVEGLKESNQGESSARKAVTAQLEALQAETAEREMVTAAAASSASSEITAVREFAVTALAAAKTESVRLVGDSAAARATTEVHAKTLEGKLQVAVEEGKTIRKHCQALAVEVETLKQSAGVESDANTIALTAAAAAAESAAVEMQALRAEMVEAEVAADVAASSALSEATSVRECLDIGVASARADVERVTGALAALQVKFDAALATATDALHLAVERGARTEEQMMEVRAALESRNGDVVRLASEVEDLQEQGEGLAKQKKQAVTEREAEIARYATESSARRRVLSERMVVRRLRSTAIGALRVWASRSRFMETTGRRVFTSTLARVSRAVFAAAAVAPEDVLHAWSGMTRAATTTRDAAAAVERRISTTSAVADRAVTHRRSRETRSLLQWWRRLARECALGRRAFVAAVHAVGVTLAHVRSQSMDVLMLTWSTYTREAIERRHVATVVEWATANTVSQRARLKAADALRRWAAQARAVRVGRKALFYAMRRVTIERAAGIRRKAMRAWRIAYKLGEEARVEDAAAAAMARLAKTAAMTHEARSNRAAADMIAKVGYIRVAHNYPIAFPTPRHATSRHVVTNLTLTHE